MLSDYNIVSPSLEGVLNEDSLTYEGLKRPVELLRVLDGPRAKGQPKKGETGDDARDTSDGPVLDLHKQKMLEQYFHDLYGVFMKNLSHFVVQSEVESSYTVKLQAMLQEMIKVKSLMTKS